MVGVVHLKRPIEMNGLSEKHKVEKDPRVRRDCLLLSTSTKVKMLSFNDRQEEQRTVERWIRAWSKKGYEGLLPKFTGGPKPRLSEMYGTR